MKWIRSIWKRLDPTAAAGGIQPSFEIENNFTPRAQQVLALARLEADRFNHHFVGTEHLLLGLIRLGQGVAVNVLQKLGLDLDTVRKEVEEQVGTGPDHKSIGNVPYTPRVKKVLALAAKEAKALNHTYVGTEHILLGLLREGDGVAARVLKSLDVNVEETRQQILQELDPNYGTSNEGSPAPKQCATPRTETKPQPPQPDAIDISKRYDVFCTEENQVVVYRNILIRGRRSLLKQRDYEAFSEFLELEQANGQVVFVARRSVIKFCEHGQTPSPEIVPKSS
jgi:ATP-dependent Clp protease ATP-binding subunit ClpA